jgi:5-methylcytosine-specific restriction endonuclease McrA
MPKGIFKHELLSEEHKRKLSKAHKGKKHTEITKQKISNAHKGKICDEETRRKISQTKKGKIPYVMSIKVRQKMGEARRGEKHWNWQGGITSLVYQIRHSYKYRQWRSDVFTRDDFTCQECSRRGGNLEAHHSPKSFSEIIREYNIKTLEEALNCEELWNINGGITLCDNCHNLTKIK